MGIRAAEGTDPARSVLMVDDDPQRIGLVRQALVALGQPLVLMVISHPAELRLYLEDTMRLSRPPAAIVVHVDNPAVVALLAWIRIQRNRIADIPIISIGSDVRQLHPNPIDAAQSPTAELLLNALRRAVQKRSANGN